MRARILRPSLFQNELLGAADPLATLLYEGLWCLADYDGRLEDRPAKIKGLVFPHRDCDVNALLDMLASMRDDEGHAFITRYATETGKRLIQVSKNADTFREHAKPHKDESCGEYPPPPEISGGFAKLTAPSPPYSPSSSPPNSPSAKERVAKKKVSTEGFDEFWEQYPRKEAKAKAIEAWNRLQPDQTIRAAILGALSRQKISGQWLRDGGRFIPLPATYLNGNRWEDEPLSLASHEPETAPLFIDRIKAQAERLKR